MMKREYAEDWSREFRPVVDDDGNVSFPAIDVREHLEAWRLDLEERLWRAQACLACGLPDHGQEQLAREVAAFKAVACGTIKRRPT